MKTTKENEMEITSKTAKGMKVILEAMTERTGVRVSFEMNGQSLKLAGYDYGQNGIIVHILDKRAEVSVPRADFDKVMAASRSAVNDFYRIEKNEDGLLWIVAHGDAHKLVELGIASGTSYITITDDAIEALGQDFTLAEAEAYAEAKPNEPKTTESHLEYRRDGAQGEYPCEVAADGSFIRWMQ